MGTEELNIWNTKVEDNITWPVFVHIKHAYLHSKLMKEELSDNNYTKRAANNSLQHMYEISTEMAVCVLYAQGWQCDACQQHVQFWLC